MSVQEEQQVSELAEKDKLAVDRLTALFDDGAFTEIDGYAKSASGDVEAAAGFGTVNGCPVYAFAQNVNVNGGAISVAQCAKLKKIYDLATKTGCPVIGIYDSNGVKLDEGFEALSAYGELVKASTAMSGVCTQVSIIAGSCLGASALMANMADVVIAVKDADFYVTTPSDVTADASYEQGTVDILADDLDGALTAAKDVVALLPGNNLSPAPVYDFTAPSVAVADAGSVVELKGGYATHCVTALATVGGTTVGFVAFDGSAVCPACAYKAEAFVKLCDAYNLPILTVADADGFVKDAENAMLTAATRMETAYATATCPKIALITSKSIGGAYIALAGKGANADLTFAWDTAVLSPLDAEAAVAFLYSDRLAAGENRGSLVKEYKETLASPYTAAASGAIDDVIVPADSRAKVMAALDILAGKRENTLPRKHSVK
mgnify:CR=1 FL=1